MVRISLFRRHDTLKSNPPCSECQPLHVKTGKLVDTLPVSPVCCGAPYLAVLAHASYVDHGVVVHVQIRAGPGDREAVGAPASKPDDIKGKSRLYRGMHHPHAEVETGPG